MANKLELTWYGKEKKFKIEPRLLIENKVLYKGFILKEWSKFMDTS